MADYKVLRNKKYNVVASKHYWTGKLWLAGKGNGKFHNKGLNVEILLFDSFWHDRIMIGYINPSLNQ